jgi:long-chain acyl-CoA synthetase
VPYEINPDRYTSLLELMDEAFRKFADLPAYANMGKHLTFRELDVLSRQFGAYLQSLGLQKGDRIAIQMPNLLQYPVAMFGAFRAGLVVVNTNPLYTPREMEHQFRDAGAKAIVILANFAHNLQKVLPNTDVKHVVVTEIGDMLSFPKKQIVNLVVKRVKKMVPDYSLPGAVSMTEALQRAPRLPSSRCRWGAKTLPSSSTRAVPPAYPKGPRLRTATSLPTWRPTSSG